MQAAGYIWDTAEGGNHDRCNYLRDAQRPSRHRARRDWMDKFLKCAQKEGLNRPSIFFAKNAKYVLTYVSTYAIL